MELQKLKQLKELLTSFTNTYYSEYPISSENAECLKGSISEIIEERDHQECTSCNKYFDSEMMKEDAGSNYFCLECYEELAPVMKAEYDELVRKGEVDPDEEYLKRLKKEDYIAWDMVVNDPLVVGSDSGTGLIFPVIVMIILLGFIIVGFIL